MASVYFCSPTNSTYFTTCCNVAVTKEETKCPRCGANVPATDGEKWEAAFGPKRRRIIRQRNLGPDDCLMCGKNRSSCNC